MSPWSFWASRGPVLVDVRITVFGQPYRAWVARFLAERLDADQSESLSIRELRGIPERLIQRLPVDSAGQILQQIMTGDEELEEVPAQQFSDWLSQQLDPGLEVVAESLPPAQAVRLGSLVDSDNDGRVSSEELGDGLYTLRFRDLDDDQTFSVSELLPFRDPRNQQAP